MTFGSSPTERAAPTVGALFFLLMVAYWPSISGAGTAPRWALLSVGVPMLIFFASNEVPKISTVAAAFLAYATASLFWTPSIYEGLDALWKLYLLAGLFLIGAKIEDLTVIWVGAAVGIAFNAPFVIAQVAGFDPVARVPGPAGLGAGLFLNKNIMAETATLVLVSFLPYLVKHLRWWWLLAVAAAALLPVARGAILGLAAAGLVWLWPRSRFAAIMLVLAGALAVAISFSYAPITSASERFNIWRDTLSGLTWFGHGVGSFYQAFPLFAVHNDILAVRTDHAHSDGLELLFEFGAGVLLVLPVVGYALFGRDDGARLVLIAFLVEGCFGFPSHCPATAALAAVALGHLCAHRHPVREHIAAGRMVPRGGVARPGDVRQPAPV